MHLKDLLFLLPKISFFPNLHPEMFPEYVFERGFTNSASFFTEKRGASFSQFPLAVDELLSIKCVFPCYSIVAVSVVSKCTIIKNVINFYEVSLLWC